MKFVFRWAVAYFVFDAVVMRLVSYNGEFTDDNACRRVDGSGTAKHTA